MSEAVFFVLCVLAGWLIADRYAKRVSRDLLVVQKTLMARIDSLEGALVKGEKEGAVKLERNVQGAITAAQFVTIDTAAGLQVNGYAPTISIGPARPSAASSPEIA